MKPDFTNRLLIPAAFQPRPELRIDDALSKRAEVVYYPDPGKLPLSGEDTIQLLVIPDNDFRSLSSSIPKAATLGLILIETGLDAEMPDPDSEQALGWVDADNISNRHWNYLLKQSLARLEKRRYFRTLQTKINQHEQKVKELYEIGISLSTEKKLHKLLDLIVEKSRQLTRADGGSLYLLQPVQGVPDDPQNYLANKELSLRVTYNHSRDISLKNRLNLQVSPDTLYGNAILNRRTIHIDDVYNLPSNQDDRWGGQEIDEFYNYRTKSILTVPMINHRKQAVGAIQLINCKKNAEQILGQPESILKEVTPFDQLDVKVMESVASQAAVAVESAQLFDSIQILFDGFINASVKAIESRDPTTSGHSSRVATLTIALAETANQLQSGPCADIRFTPDQLNEVRYASLLHDFGKIGVKESVLVKSKKLYPEEEQAVKDRFRLIRQGLELEMSQRQLAMFLEASREEALVQHKNESGELEDRLQALDEYLKFILNANEPTVLAQGGFEKLDEIGRMEFLHPDGEKTPYLSPYEVSSLSVAKGSLNENDRQEIESHVTHTYNFLNIIPWSNELARVPNIAYAHHEKLDGTGYPRNLTAEEIPVQSKMMTIADIYDALTAWDRPYKKAMPAERALNILGFEAKDNHVDQDLLDLFIDAKIYQLVSRPVHGTDR